MNNELLVKGAKAVSMFCRLNVNAKKNLPIRSSEMGLLIWTAQNDTFVTPAMAAEFFNVSKPMIAKMVNSLTLKGYLLKEPSKADKRSYIIKPSKQAVALVEAMYEEYFKEIQLLKDKMGIKRYKSMIELLKQANCILSQGENSYE